MCTPARQNGRVSTVQAPDRRSFRAAGGLKWLVGYAAFGLGISTLYVTTGVGFPCPFRALDRLGVPVLRGHPAGIGPAAR